jgi:hypothetical protein
MIEVTPFNAAGNREPLDEPVCPCCTYECYCSRCDTKGPVDNAHALTEYYEHHPYHT